MHLFFLLPSYWENGTFYHWYFYEKVIQDFPGDEREISFQSIQIEETEWGKKSRYNLGNIQM